MGKGRSIGEVFATQGGINNTPRKDRTVLHGIQKKANWRADSATMVTLVGHGKKRHLLILILLFFEAQPSASPTHDVGICANMYLQNHLNVDQEHHGIYGLKKWAHVTMGFLRNHQKRG